MEEKTDAPKENKSQNSYLVLGSLLVVAVLVLGGVWYFMSQTTQAPATPVSALKCSSAFYNYVVGKPQIIVSASGEDTTATKAVTCQFNYTDPSGTPSAGSAIGTLSDVAGGKNWRCSDKDKLFSKGTTKFNVTVTNDRGDTSTCNNTIYLP